MEKKVWEGRIATVGKVLAPLMVDRRIGPVHVCLYLAIWQCGERQARNGWMMIRREELMRLAKISGRTTYYRVMGDLARWGYIGYRPSLYKRQRSRARINQA